MVKGNNKRSGKHSGKNAERADKVALTIAHSKSSKGGKHSANGRHPLHETRIDLPAKARVRICEILNQTLAESLDLQTQIKQAHWNVKGVHFYQLHLLFDELAGEIEDYVDLFAERITTLGGTAMGTVRMAAKASRLPEYPTDITDGLEHVVALAERFAKFGASVRDNIDKTDDLGDLDTADIYTEVSRTVDKRLWFLEAHLQAESASHELSL
jgi:starvation-inducible DNA-binding protein